MECQLPDKDKKTLRQKTFPVPLKVFSAEFSFLCRWESFANLEKTVAGFCPFLFGIINAMRDTQDEFNN